MSSAALQFSTRRGRRVLHVVLRVFHWDSAWKPWAAAHAPRPRANRSLTDLGYSGRLMERGTLEAVRLSVVLPCLNEEGAVGAVIDDAWPGIESTGMPGEVARRRQRLHRSLGRDRRGARRTRRPRVASAATAARTSAALAEAQGEYIVMADADGTYPLDDLPPVRRTARRGRRPGARLALPREHPQGRDAVAAPLGREPGADCILNVFFGVSVSDAHCGMRAIKRSASPSSTSSRPAWSSPRR